MCVKPSAVFIYKRPGDEKWMTKYTADVTRDEALRYGLDLDVLTARAHGLDAKWSIVPCGQCFECRLQRSRVWANRCAIEMADFPPIDGVCRNWFVTLTYAPGSTDELRSAKDGCTLSLHVPEGNKKDHLQMFNNAVRQKWKRDFGHDGIRFYACGEYGDLNARPHYHEILFNLPIDPAKLEFLFVNRFGHRYYNYEPLSEAWSDKGFVVISEANWDTAAYTARYIMKKQLGKDAALFYDTLGLLPPFTRMSLKPGIGFSAFKGYDTYCNIDETTGELNFKNKLILPHAPQGVDPSVSIPRYFDKIMEREDPDFMEVVKAWREKYSDIAYQNRKRTSSLSDRDLFEAREEDYNKRKIGMLRNFFENI